MVLVGFLVTFFLIFYNVCGKILIRVVEGYLTFKSLLPQIYNSICDLFDANSFKVIICISHICVILLATR